MAHHLKNPNETDMKINKHLWASVPATSQKKHAHQSSLMGTRMKIVWRTKSCKVFDILHRRPRPHGTSDQTSPPWEQTWTSIWEAYDTLRNKNMHTSHKRGFILPCIPFSSSHFHDMLTRALYNKHRYRYRYSPAEKNLHLFFLHHSCIGLTLSQLVETIFWSMKIPNPLVTDMLV